MVARTSLYVTLYVNCLFVKDNTYAIRMNNRMPKIILHYRPNRRRRLGRPLQRLLDEDETGISRPKS